MDYVYIEQLIDRYFEAATTIEEERILRAFFSQRDVPQHLRRYAPIFLMEAGEIA
ncbi:MAG: pyruvate ferredoxin oxidoreductase, partial [Prevotellaceae bacterium]|nr:pyruvate ferredoxin oxidoreductase [Prevotellaceae bacterium]